MDTDTPKISRRLILFLGSFIFSAAVYAQTCKPVSGACPAPAGVTCTFAANIEKGCNCYDGIDNDGDGKIDGADIKCAPYILGGFVGSGSTCSIPPPGNVGSVFTGVANVASAAQNTADTPAHVAVGDMNGDGVPDAVVTSKWNQTIQVVATATASGFSPGDIMGDFRPNGSKLFDLYPGSSTDYTFEHEMAIADVDKDGIGEMYSIVSYRKGGPNATPEQYYLVGFKYASGKGNLIPLFTPAPLGPNRPGNPGLADFNGDGKPEIYIRNQIYAAEKTSGTVNAASGLPVKLADGGGDWLTAINTGSVAVDIDKDGNLELVCGNFVYKVPSLSGRTLQTLTVYKDMNVDFPGTKFYPKGYNDVNEYGITQASSTSVADFDEDGSIDVFITGAVNCSGNEASPCGTNKTTIFYWNIQKNTLQTYQPPDGTYALGWNWGTGRVNLYDVYPNHGHLEALFTAGNKVFCLDEATFTTGTPLWVRTTNDALSGILSLTCYDFNNDGNPEVVYRDTQQLIVCDGQTGATTIFATTCQSHTMTEGPIIADVNGDGATDICITCYTNTGAFDINKSTVQQQSLGQLHLYYTNSSSWLPTRKVWNQHPYYVVNILDNLQLPTTQVSQNLVFGTGACPNGVQGPQMPLNLFMDQVPRLSASGCPEFPAPDITFYGDDPTQPGVDTNGDGKLNPTVIITPPICGNLGITAQFNIANNGDLAISDNIPISFFNGDPTANPVTATKLYSTTMTVTNLGIGSTFTSPVYSFNGPGSAFTLYVVVYNNGNTLPITLTGGSTKECSISNNIYSTVIAPTPFTVTVETVQNNLNCPPYAAGTNNGQLRARIYIAGVEQTDYSPYAFQWYDASSVPISGATLYNLSNLDQGTYYVRVTNTQKGCQSSFVPGTIIRANPGFPNFVITKISDQTLCSPANGELVVAPDDGSTGYTYKWLDLALNPIGVTGADAKNLLAGNYVVQITRGTCINPTSPQSTVAGPKYPDAIATTVANVVDCLNPNSGSVTADATFNGVAQNPAGYTFKWYFYNIGPPASTGSILPAGNGTGPTRTGLAAGYYQVVVTDNATLCNSTTSPTTQVTTSTVLPTAAISEVAKQTSCDPNQPNGILTAVGTAAGYTSPTDFKFEWFRGDNTLVANLIPIAGGPETVSGAKGETLNKAKGGGIIYTVKVTTPLNCSATNKLAVTEDVNKPVLTLAQSPNSICDVTKTNPVIAYNGSITATVTFTQGGVTNTITLPDPKYTFNWYDGTTTTTAHNPATSGGPTLSGLKDADYTAMVTRTDLFCTSVPQTKTVLKTTISPILNPTSTGSNNCDPALTPDGTVSAGLSNSQPGHIYSYQWYKGNAVVPANALGAANTGTSATATKVGGPVGAPNPYTVYVLDLSTGCDNTSSQFVADNSVVPVLSTSVTGNGVCNPALGFLGTMTATVTNPPAGYTQSDYRFRWFNGSDTSSFKVQQVSPLNALDSKSFTVVAKNTKTGCQSSIYTNTVPNNKVFPTLAMSSTGSHNCIVGNSNGVAVTNDGSASVLPSGTPGPYTFAWHTGNIDPTTAPNPIAGATSSALNGVGGPMAAPYSYTVLVTDSGTGCQAFAPAVVSDLSVNPILSATTQPNDICSPAANRVGSMTVALSNAQAVGTFPNDYTFQWFDDATGTTAHSPATSTNPTLSILDAGAFSVIGTNNKTGCPSPLATNNVGNGKVNPVLSITSAGSHNCSTTDINGNPIKPDGTAKVDVTPQGPAGADTFTYVWTSVGTAPAPTSVTNVASPPSSTANQVGGPNPPAPGTWAYNLSVTNNRTGCNSTGQAQVADISAKPTMTLQPFDNTVCDPTLITIAAQTYNGHVDETSVTNNIAAGYVGATSYRFTWTDVSAPATGHPVATQTNTASSTYTLLPEGNYTGKVTIVELGCTSDPVPAQVSKSFTIPAIQTQTNANVKCVAPFSGDTKVTFVDGNPAPGNYSYKWYNGAVVAGAPRGETTEIGPSQIQGPNTYTVQVTNSATGCQGNTPVTIVDANVKPTISLAASDNTNCSGTPNGQLTSTITNGGAAPQITYTPGGVQPAVYGSLAAGSYSAVVQDTNTGCTSAPDSRNIIDSFTYPVISVSPTPQTSCDVNNPNGKLDATGTTPAGVTFTWFDGVGTGGSQHAQTSVNSGIIDKLQATSVSTISYTVKTEIAATGCFGTQTFNVPGNITHPVVTLVNSQQVTTCGTSPNGEATTTIAGLKGIPDFPTIKYDLFYVYTKAGGTYPTDSTTLVTSGDANNKNNATALPAAPSYTGMAPGYLTAYVIDKNTLCTSVINTVQIKDATQSYTFTINATSAAGLCNGGGGGIDVTVDRSDNPGVNCVSCTYSWYQATPTNSNINFFDNPPNMGGSPVLVAPLVNNEDLGAPTTPVPGVGQGTYTLVVLDTDLTHKDCGNYFVGIVPPTNIPNIAVVPTHVTDCITPNGSLNTITVTGASVQGYSIEVFSGTNNTGASLFSVGLPPGAPMASPATLVTPVNLAKGDYYVEVKDYDGTNENCPLGSVSTIKQIVAPPLVSASIASPNSSCDPNNTPDGQVQITVTNDAIDTQGKNYQIDPIAPAVTGYATPNTIGTGANGQSEIIPGMRPIGYTITVVDAISHCSTDVPVIVPDVQSIPSSPNLTIVAETDCDPLSNGAANILSFSGAEPTSQFDFIWSKSNTLAPTVYGPLAGNAGHTAGDLLDKTKVAAANWIMPGAGLGAGNRTFYMQAVKNNTAPSGVGCKTGIIQVDIPDQHISPDMTLVTAFDSFCKANAGNPVVGDGKITITPDANPATGAQDIPVAGFQYTWAPVPGGAGTVPPQTSVAVSYVINQLYDATYTVTIKNNDNGCTTSNSAIIAPAPYVIAIDNNTLINKRICRNDGRIKITSVTLTDFSAGASPPVPDTDTDAPASVNLQSLYNFSWFTDPLLTAGNELNGVGVTPIIAQTLSNDSDKDGTTGEPGDYNSMDAVTYYVTATRNDPTKIGFGCPSLPYRVDVKDVHQNPVASLTVLSNTSCDPAAPGEGEIKINIATDSTDPFFKPVPPAATPLGFTYTYAWSGGNAQTLPGVPPYTSPAAVQVGNGNGANGDAIPVGDKDYFTQLLDSATPYGIAITNNQSGCTVNVTATIIKNSVPVFVQSVTPVDEIKCDPVNGDGSLTVTKVTVNNRIPPPTDYVTAPGAGQGNISDFNFTWTRQTVAGHSQSTAGNVLSTATYNNAALPGGFGKPIGADTYTVVATRVNNSPGRGCSSAPFSVDIRNLKVNPSVTLTPFSNTSCSGTFEGVIKVKVSDLTTATPPAGGFKFDYDWTGSPNLAVLSAVNSSGNNGDEANNGVPVDHDYEGAVQDDVLPYKLKVTNPTTGCLANATAVVTKNATPVFIPEITPVDPIVCLPNPDGSITVQKVTLNTLAGTQTFTGATLLSDFQFEWTRVGDANNYTEITNGAALPAGAILDKTTYIVGLPGPPPTGFAAPLGAGTYTIVARRKSGTPGANCPSAPYTVMLQDKSVNPIAFLTPFANTSCDPAFFEGELRIKVTDSNPTTPPAGGFKFDYKWLATATPAVLPVNSTFLNNDGDSYGAGEPDGGVVGNPPDNDSDFVKALKENDPAVPALALYTVEVTNQTTGCKATASTSIFKNGTPVFTQSVFPTPQVLCTPDGSLEVQKITLEDRQGNLFRWDKNKLVTDLDYLDVKDFDFDWTTPANTVVTTRGINGVVSGGVILDNNPVTGYPLIGFGTYYVVTKRVSGSPGKDCSSPPYRIDIDDQRLYPKVAFTSIANSSCNVTKANGSVTAIASEQNGAQTDPYTFGWTLNGGAVPAPAIQTDATPQSVITNALDGAYIATATNTNTGCQFAASFNLLLDQTRSTPNIIDVAAIDPIDCNPSAQAEVTKITLGSQTNSSLFPPQVPPNNEVTGPALLNFIFSWYQGTSLTGPLFGAGAIATTPCIGPNCVTNPPTSGVTSGTYFVVVKDPTTDCQSGPKEVVIKDDNIKYPIAGITQTVKQISCIATIGKAELQASAIEQDGTTGNYTFTWYPSLDLTGTAFGPPTAPSTVNNPNVLQQLVVGNYSVQVKNTVTSCTAQALFIVPDDSPFFTPAISTGSTPQTFCVGTDGDAQVRILLDPGYPLLPYDNTSFTTDLYKTSKPNLNNPPDVQANIPFVFTGSPSTITYDVPGLVSGTYTFRVTDKNTGCFRADSVVVKLQQTKPVIIIVQDNPMTNCDPVIANGQLSATADGKVQGYTFDWYAGATATGSILQTDNKLIGQRFGQFTVRATNNFTGCFDDKNGNITDATVLPPMPIAVTLHDQTSCILPYNGEVAATVGGVTLGYSFQWYNGTSVKPAVDFKFADYFNLDVGDYTVTATDDITLCVSPPATTPVVDKRVKPVFDVAGTPSYCIDVGRPTGNGTFTLTQKTSEAFAEVKWSLAGDTTATIGLGPYIADLFPGDYHVLVTTYEGCQKSENVKIETEIKPFNLVSTNGDGQNDAFIIDCISNFTVAGGAPRDNNVKIFNRNGTLVYEADGYNNLTVFFRGVGEKGVYLSDKELPEGTYFYIIDKRNGEKPKSGFIELVR